jgi:hypothetical protein
MMSEGKIIYRSVFGQQYGLAEFNQSIFETIGAADCINVQDINIIFCGVYNDSKPARKCMVEEKGRDGSIALISNYREPLLKYDNIRTLENQNLINKFPSIKVGHHYCSLLCIDGPPDGIIFYELPFSFNAKIKTVNTLGCALMFNPKTSVQTRVNFCRSYGLNERIVLT